jgi:hypothetical protein
VGEPKRAGLGRETTARWERRTPLLLALVLGTLVAASSSAFANLQAPSGAPEVRQRAAELTDPWKSRAPGAGPSRNVSLVDDLPNPWASAKPSGQRALGTTPHDIIDPWATQTAQRATRATLPTRAFPNEVALHNPWANHASLVSRTAPTRISQRHPGATPGPADIVDPWATRSFAKPRAPKGQPLVEIVDPWAS